MNQHPLPYTHSAVQTTNKDTIKSLKKTTRASILPILYLHIILMISAFSLSDDPTWLNNIPPYSNCHAHIHLHVPLIDDSPQTIPT